MDIEEQDFLGISSGKDAPTTNPPLDTLAKTLVDGYITRGQALKLMGAGAAAASLALAGCGGGKDRAKGSASGSREPSGGSTSGTTVGQKGSTPKQGTGAAGEVAAAAKRATEKYRLKAVLVRVIEGNEEVATLAMGESMTGVPDAAHARQLYLRLRRLRGHEVLRRRPLQGPVPGVDHRGAARLCRRQAAVVRAGHELELRAHQLRETGRGALGHHGQASRLGSSSASASSSHSACGARRATRPP
jgi:hypothetical protein